jgi:outer membrane receptor protein involved in Fe transport
MKKLFMFLSILSVFILAVAAYGDETATDTEKKGQSMKHLTMEEIVVTDQAITEPTITVVGVKTIEKGKNTNIPDVLKYEPDIDISRRALMGDTADILSIRGLSGNRIMLNINNRPVNASGVVGGYYIDWGTIPLDNIERIEIIKGGSSVRYSDNALGGVINIITKQPTEKPTFTIYGTYGGGSDIDYIQNYRATHSYKIGPFGYSLAGSYQKAAPFLWNNDFEGLNLSSSFNIDMPLHGEMLLGFQYANTKRGFIRENRLSDDPDNADFYKKRNSGYPLSFGEMMSPPYGKAFIPGPGAEWNKTKYYMDFGYKQPIADGLLEVKAYKNIEDRKEKNYSDSSINSTYPNGKLVLDQKVGSDRSYGGSIDFTKPLSNHELLGGIEYKVLAYGDTTVHYVDATYNGNPYAGFKPSNEGIMWGYFIQDNWKITDKILLTPGVRYDTYNIKSIHGNTAPDLKDEAITPKITGTYKVTDSDTLTASVYQALRTPGMPEVYWWYYGMTGGTPSLKAEKNNAGELTYQHDFGKGSYGRLAMYYYGIDDFIVMRFDPNWRGAYNIDNVKLWGGSLDGRATITGWLSAKANITYQKSKKEGDSFDQARLTDELDYLPEWKGNLGLEFSLPYKSVLTTTLRYVGEQHTIYAYSAGWGWPPEAKFKLMTLDSYVTADTELKIPVMKYGEISFYAENLFDKKYEERFGYPLPGRIIGASAKIMF